jgi:hypothetical protein
MKLGEAIKKAVQERDAAAVGGIADFLRFKLGMNYEQSFQFVHKLIAIARDEWEVLLYESEAT